MNVEQSYIGPNYEELSNQMFARVFESGLLEVMMDHGLSESDSIIGIVRAGAIDILTSEHPKTKASTAGQINSHLIGWHSVVMTDCSSLYAELRNANPDASRDEINEVTGLSQFNAVRRGIHAAIGDNRPGRPLRHRTLPGGSLKSMLSD